MKILKRIALSFMSDEEIMTLFVSLEVRFIRLQQQSMLTYWVEEAAVAGNKEIGWPFRQQEQGIKAMETALRARKHLMEARPKLFKKHRWHPTSHINVTDSWHWESRPTWKAYDAIQKKQNPRGHYSRQTRD